MSRIKDKLVSIVIPTYQRPKYFIEALESVLAQTHTNLEIFVTDNSHNTETKEEIQKYLKEDSRIIYEHHPEYMDGISNWQRAMSYDNPRAEYVNWLMDDDLFKPNKIEDMLRAYEAYPDVALVTSSRELIDENGDVINVLNSLKLEVDTICPGANAGKMLFINMNNYIGEPTTALIKKANQCNNTLGWYPTQNSLYGISDFPTWCACLEHGNLLYMVEPRSSFRIHPSQQQRDTNIRVAIVNCWGLLIEYAWKNKIYIDDYSTYVCCVKLWRAMFAQLTEHLHDIDYSDCRRLNDLIEMYNKLDIG